MLNNGLKEEKAKSPTVEQKTCLAVYKAVRLWDSGTVSLQAPNNFKQLETGEAIETAKPLTKLN